jgi:hypothetical protein
MTPAVADLTTAPAVAADLLLVRLLPATKKPPGLSTLRPGLNKLLPRPLGSEVWSDVVARLRADGLVENRGLRLTDAGRSRALAFLGVDSVAEGVSWRQIVSGHLFPKALGATASGRGKVIPKEKLAARLLKRKHGLPVGADPTLSQVSEALVCRELGYPDLATLKELKQQVLSRLCKSDDLLDEDQLAKALPVTELSLPVKWGVDVLRERIVADWLTHADRAEPAPTPESEPAEFDLPAFAATVRAAARHCPTGHFGEDKVFISHLWNYLRAEPNFPELDLPAFKWRLVEANVAGLLELSRADLVQAMDPADVSGSETTHLNAAYHFVRAE